MDTLPKLLLDLIQDQKTSKFTDAKFAHWLGISVPLWKKTKAGKRAVGLTLLRAIARVKPQAYQDIFEYLKDSTGDNDVQ